MTRSSREWLVPLTGVAFIIVLIVGFVVGGEPESADEGAQAVVDWYVDNKDAANAGAMLSVLAGVLLIVFGSYLRRELEGAGAYGVMPLVAFIGTVIVAIGAAIDATIMIAAAEAADDEVEAQAILALQALWDNDWVPFALGIACFLWGSGVSILTSGALPKWLGWIMVVLGVIAFTPIGFAAFLASGLLVLVISIMLILRARKGDAGTPAAPPGPAAPVG